MTSGRNLIPKSLFDAPFRFLERFPFFEEGEEWNLSTKSTGLTISEDDNNILVRADVPGLKEDQIDVTFENGVVWIQGQKKEETEDKKKKYYCRSASTVSYRFPLPGNFDDKKEPNASLRDGVLELTFPKTQKAQPKKINIKKKS